MLLSYTTNPTEDAAITYALGIENARLAALAPSQGPITAAQYLTQVLAAVFASYKQQSGDADVQQIKATYQAATDAKKAAILAAAVAAAK